MWILWVLGILLIVLLAIYLITIYFFNMSFVRDSDEKKTRDESYLRLRDDGMYNIDARVSEGRAYLETLSYEDVYIQSFDRLKLHAKFYQNGESKRTIVLVHGYKSFGEHNFACVFELYRSLGLNFLIVDQRSHGESEGKYITFGVKERQDICDWCKYLVSKDKDCEILLGGISMGCTTVLLAAALPEIPSNVIGIIADCGYVTPRDEFAHVMKHDMRVPRFPFLDVADLIARRRAQFGFSDVSTLDAVKVIDIPILFIHGEADTFVPFENTLKNYEASVSQNKKLIIVPKAEHGLSYLVDEAGCRRSLTEFISSL